jgi:hypothetical protein
MVKAARNVVADVMAGKGIEITKEVTDKNGEKIEVKELVAVPTASNRIAAASMVYDRFEPVVTIQQHTGTITHAVDLSQYSNREVMDIEPCTQVCEITDGKDKDV